MARLPLKLATASLISLIVEASGELKSQPDPVTLASRIVGLLPRPSGLSLGSNSHRLTFDASSDQPLFAVVIFALMVLVSIFFVTSVKPTSAPNHPATDTSSRP